MNLDIRRKARNLLDPGDGLYQRAVRSGAWIFALGIVAQGFALIRLVILARVLAPHDSGLFGIAMLAMAALTTFTETGFRTALIWNFLRRQPSMWLNQSL